MQTVGISIGAFVGLISGIIVLAILRTLSTASINDAGSIKILSVQLLSVVTIVAGASFLVQNTIFPEETVEEIAFLYFHSVLVTFLVLMFYPLYRWIYKLGRELGETGQQANGNR